MPRYDKWLLAVALSISLSAFAADSNVVRVEIKSSWGGLGKPQNTELLILRYEGQYRCGRAKIDHRSIDALADSIRESVQAKPTLENLGMTEEWLKNEEVSLERDAQGNDGGDSALYKLDQGSADQKLLFRRSYTDPRFVKKILPNLFRCCHTDDWPTVRVTVTYADGSQAILSSHAQSEFMLPWKVEVNNAGAETFNKNISRAVASLMPDKAANRERISGDGLGLALAWQVMDAIEKDWNLSNVQAHASSAIVKIGTVYEIRSADINPYHDVTFGVYVKGKVSEGEENLHVELKRKDFPPGFDVTAILLYQNDKVLGVEEFLQDIPRYENLVLSIPWLMRRPRLGTTLLWVHDRSFSNKALQNFAADMHSLGKDELANEVSAMQSQVAVLNVSYGDWWLVLPDRRMILWRYESVQGLLGWKKADFHEHECTDYQGITGGCVGALFSPEGELIN